MGVIKCQKEKNGLIITSGFTLIMIILSCWSIKHEEYFLIAISMGALGGLIHEFSQSGGKIWFFRKADDGYYLESLAGMLLGMVAGILLFRGQLTLLENPVYEINVYELAIDVFMAGLALKGVTEAASGNISPWSFDYYVYSVTANSDRIER